MSRHIKLDGIECDFLQHVTQGNCWVCLQYFCEFDDSEFCFRCKFERQRKKEEAIIRGLKRK